MIYWYVNTDDNKILFSDREYSSLTAALNDIKNSFHVGDCNSGFDEDYEFVFWDKKIIAIIRLNHECYRKWDNEDYCYDIVNHFYIIELDQTQDGRLMDMDYILQLKMGVITQ